MPSSLPVMRAKAPELVRSLVAQVTYSPMLAALAVVTLLPFAVAVWAVRRPASRAALWSVLLIQAALALNVVSHLVVAAFLRGYGPGLATAILVNLPFSVYLFRRATAEHWLSNRALFSLIPAAIILHGPALVGLIALTGFLVRAPR